MKHYDAVVAGMGPTGVTLANLLGARGWNVLVIDSAHTIYPLPRAITADHEVMRTFQSIGVADDIARGILPHPGSDYLGVDGGLIKTFYSAPSPNPLGWDQNFLFYQPELESRLRQQLERVPSVEQRLGTTLKDAVDQCDSVVVSLEQDGTTETIETQFLIGCDGARSRTRSLLDPTITDLEFDEWWVVVDANQIAETELPDRVTHYCHPSRPGSFIIGPDRLRRWEIKILPHEDPQDFHDPEVVRRTLSELIDADAFEITRIAVYRFHALVVDEWRRGRILLAGDAAHQMPPFLGQGMCAGIRDVTGLAWKLDAVAKRGWPLETLDAYQEEMRPHVQAVVAAAKSFGEIIGELDLDRARERDARLRETRSRTPDMTRQDIIPPLTTGMIEPASGGAGRHLPQPWVGLPTGDRVRLDDVLGNWFSVVCFEDGAGTDGDRLISDAARALGARRVVVGPARDRAHTATAPGSREDVTNVVDLDGTLVDWASRLGIRWAVVRPDRYVYGTAVSGADAAVLLGQLAAKSEGKTTASI